MRTRLQEILTPLTRLGTMLRPPTEPDEGLAPPAEPDEDLAPPTRLRQILSVPPRAEEGMRLPSQFREILMPSTRLKDILQPRTQGRMIVLGGVVITAVLGVSFFISLKMMDALSPRGTTTGPAIAELPPLPPVTRNSVIIAPVTISLGAIHEIAERNTPHDFAGKATNPVSRVLQNADIGWSATRGPIRATGADDTLSLTTPLVGKLNVTGSLSSKATGAVGDALGSLLGDKAAKQIGSINIKQLNASAEIKGNIIITARPRLAAAWHLEPNFGAQVNLGNTDVLVAGA